jgi:ribosomal protein S18 acetylase RimI-like enzyme
LAIERGGVCGFRLYVEKENSRAQKIYEHLSMTEAHYLMYEQPLE